MDRVGRYQLHEKLGEGGMGVVYKAYDPLLQRTVAVKLIAGNLDLDPELRERFFTEARAAGQLSHRNLVTIYDLGEEGGQPYFAMEFLEGRDLGRRMRSQEPMTLTRKLDVVAQVGEGLRYAHALGVTHRDIKPGNIFLTSTGDVKLLDFGLARLHGSELTRTRSLLGTVSYMAPEQIRGERADARTDLFSLGVVLYELLSGRRAFQGDSFATTLHKILEGTPEPLARLDPCLPAELIQIVDRALAKAPEDRYQRVDDLLVDLAAFRATIRGTDPSCLGREPGSGSGQVERPEKQGSSASVTPVSALPWNRTPAPALAPQQPAPVAPAPASGSSAISTRGPRLPLVFGGLALVVALGIPAWQFIAHPASTPGGGDNAQLASVPAVATSTSPAPAPPSTPPPPSSLAGQSRDERTTPAGTSGEAGASRTTATPSNDRGGDRDSARGSKPEPRRTDRPAAVDERARTAAQAALVELARLKGRAESAHAQELAGATFEAAHTAEQQARRLLDAGVFSRAAAGLTEAARLFERAETEARAEEARRTERQRELIERLNASRRRYQDARTRATQAGADTLLPGLVGEAATRASEGESLAAGAEFDRAARAFDAGATALEEASRRAAEARRPPPEPPAERAPSDAERRAAAERAIGEVLDRYASALESRTMARLKRVWPGLSGAHERAIEEEFRNSRSISVALSEPRIELSGNKATVICQRSYRLETRDGQRLETDTQTVLALHRDGESWVIDDVRHQPRR